MTYLEAVTTLLAGVEMLPVPGDWIVQGGAVALLGVAVMLILSGRLVPRSVYRDMERDRDQWREVALKAIGHADQLLPGAEIATEVARALSAATSRPSAVAPRRASGRQAEST